MIDNNLKNTFYDCLITWLLIIDYWLLIVDNWLLIIDNWLLITDFLNIWLYCNVIMMMDARYVSIGGELDFQWYILTGHSFQLCWTWR